MSFKRSARLELFSWMLYDFANTSFTVMIVTFVYSVYFRDIVCKGLGNKADFLWGLSGSISMVVVALFSPVLGAIADHTQAKKKFLISFALLCIAFGGMLFFIKEGMIFEGMLFFIIANIGFEGGNVFYNAFLPEITTQDRYGRISGYGWALGYLGAIVTIFMCKPFLSGGFEESNLSNVRFTFLLSAVFYLVFSLPIFFYLRERRGNAMVDRNDAYIVMGFRRLRDTFKNVKQFKELAKYLLSFFIYTDGITTVIYFSTIYARDTLHFKISELILFYITVQTTGILGALFFGWLADKLLPKKTIMITLLIWCVVVIGAYFVEDKSVFFVIGMLAGIAMGSSQSASRSMMGLLTPQDKKAEFFGFYGISGKFSAALGPFIFGTISAWTGSQRIAILAVIAQFVLGLILLQRVDEKEGILAARNFSINRQQSQND
ncbi:MAG: MFS transporter [Thermodesulfobacteriota bacterium]